MDGLESIDWWGVEGAAAWVLGLAMVLSAWSVSYYRSSVEGRRVCRVLGEPSHRLVINFGMTLVCLGLAGSAGALGEGILWLGLAGRASCSLGCTGVGRAGRYL